MLLNVKLILLLHLLCLLAQNISAQQRLSDAINSPHKELMPIITPDGKTLFFVREDHPKNLGGQDIWVSQSQPDGKWSEAINLGKPINDDKHNILYSISPDGNTILVTTDVPGKIGIAKINQNKLWESPQKIQIKNFLNKSKFSSFSLSVDGKILVMNIENDQSIGLQDLFVSFWLEDQNWSEPINLGKDINTTEYEISPFLAADNKTLYFASNGRRGYGSMDLWYTYRLDDSWKKWSKPVNLGNQINTEGFDAYLSIAASGEYAYWSTAIDPKFQNDIYTIRLPDSLKPQPVVIVKGKVFNAKTQQPLHAVIRYQSLTDSLTFGTAETNPSTGEYQIILNAPKQFALFAQAEGMFPISQTIDLKELKTFQEQIIDLTLKPIATGDTILLNNVFFDTGKASLKEESRPELNRLIELMKQNPNIKIQINGHTDDQGNNAQNQTLSEERAKAVRNYLINQKISPENIQYKGFGATKPVASNKTEQGRQKNRRVEFVIIKHNE